MSGLQIKKVLPTSPVRLSEPSKRVFVQKTPMDYICSVLDIERGVMVECERFFVPEHTHGCCEIMIPDRGVYRALLNGEIVEAKPGQFLFIQSGDVHEDRCTDPLRFGVLKFHLLDIGGHRIEIPIIKPEFPGHCRVYELPEDSAAVGLWRRVAEVADTSPPFHENISRSLSEAFFWELFAFVPSAHLSADFELAVRKKHFLATVADYMEKHLDSPLDISALAEKMHLSRRGLEYRMIRCGAESPAKLFNRLRINKASRLIEYSDVNVAEAAAAVGFKNAFHFSRIFKAVTGETPSMFRKRSRRR